MNWYLIAGLPLLAVIITLLMRPDIFIGVLRGEVKKPAPRRAVSEAEFQAKLKAYRDDANKEDNHG